ncbi:hypothetical protein PI125_g22961 [Phytophthora idaei]|nr:hypothetical protein PI125_g22961 [Phytophthora idaei]KAG3137837.1 hypothetical protein PI126_g17194 [Phytophthora idaei]
MALSICVLTDESAIAIFLACEVGIPLPGHMPPGVAVTGADTPVSPLNSE